MERSETVYSGFMLNLSIAVIACLFSWALTGALAFMLDFVFLCFGLNAVNMGFAYRKVVEIESKLSR